MDKQQFDELPPLLDVPEAARVLGIGRSLAYDLVRRGEWPTAVLRVGRLIKIPSRPLVELVETGRWFMSVGYQADGHDRRGIPSPLSGGARRPQRPAVWAQSHRTAGGCSM
jgi:excisionase family DNA binding protein